MGFVILCKKPLLPPTHATIRLTNFWCSSSFLFSSFLLLHFIQRIKPSLHCVLHSGWATLFLPSADSNSLTHQIVVRGHSAFRFDLYKSYLTWSSSSAAASSPPFLFYSPACFCFVASCIPCLLLCAPCVICKVVWCVVVAYGGVFVRSVLGVVW